MRNKKNGFCRVFLLCTVLLVLSGCMQSAPKESGSVHNESYPLEFLKSDLVSVSPRDITQTVPILGSVQSSNSVHISTKLTGILEKTFFKEGDFVRKGNLLASLDKTAIVYQKEQRKSQYDIGLSQFHMAQKDFSYAQALYRKGFVSALSFSSSRATLEQKKAQLELYEANYKEAVDNLKSADFYAPINGCIAQKLVDMGQSVTSGQALFWIVDLEHLEAVVSVPSERILTIRPGLSAKLFVGDNSFVIQANVTRVSPQAASDSHTFSVFLKLPNQNNQFRVGMFIKGFIVSGVKKNVLAIPDVAVRGETGNHFVYLISKGRIIKRSVELGDFDQMKGYVEIVNGLDLDDTVVAKDFGVLAQGTPIKIVSFKS